MSWNAVSMFLLLPSFDTGLKLRHSVDMEQQRFISSERAAYDIRPLDRSREGLIDCQKLLARVFPSATHLTVEYLHWQYNLNPAGVAVGFNAYYEDVLAAHYVALPLCARLQGETVRGLLSLNTATHPDHQGRKLFTHLAERTYEIGRRGGYRFVIGVANMNSTHGFVQKLGFQPVGTLEARIGIGPLASKSAIVDYDFASIWNKELVAWRISNPSRHYEIVPLTDGFQIETPTGKMGIYATMAKFESDLQPDGARCSSTRFNPIKLYLGLDPNVNWSRSAYFSVPRLLRPSPLNFIFKCLSGPFVKLRLEQTKFLNIDFDAF